ncbi:guanyl-nucleotide exchange factor [Aureococcus anophagefferens]|uniref:Guanyl-nucleotide exchange factor n=1 Tax=Aureococcus anophagefferens TaxID=44056 RepID=A0ABR1G8K2_AURAN
MKTSRLLRSFVPKLVRQDVASRDPSKRFRQETQGAVLFADASGFTSDDDKGLAGGEAQAVILASACAAAMQRAIAGDARLAGGPLTMHMALGCGAVTLAHLGGVWGRWVLVMDGPAMAQIALAEPLGGSGDVVLSPRAAKALRETDGSTRADSILEEPYGDAHAAHARLAMGGDLRALAAAAAAVKHSLGDVPATRGSLSGSPGDAAKIAAYVPATVCKQLLLNRREDKIDASAAELRHVSVVFAHMAGVRASAAAAVVEALQRAVGVGEGDVNKILVDDKGMLCLAVFGLPPLVHVDDATRATAAALLVVGELAALGVAASVGVTTGTAFCGFVGSSVRREYTVMGNVVNLAARLMSAAKREAGGVLVDAETRAAAASASASRDFDFRATAPLQLKGLKDRVSAFAPVEVERADGSLASEVFFRATRRTPRRRSYLQKLFRQSSLGIHGDPLSRSNAQVGPTRHAQELLYGFSRPPERVWPAPEGAGAAEARAAGGALCVAGHTGRGMHAIIDDLCDWGEDKMRWTVFRVDLDDRHASQAEALRLGFASRRGDARETTAWRLAALSMRFARAWILDLAAAAGVDDCARAASGASTTSSTRGRRRRARCRASPGGDEAPLLGGAAEEPPRDPRRVLEDFVLEYSGGVPAFVREICRHLVSSKAVVVSGTTAFLHCRRLDAAAHVPPLVATFVKLEYEGLADDEKFLLQAASVLPRFRELVVAADVFRRFFEAGDADATLHANLRVAALVESLILDDVLTLAAADDDDDDAARRARAAPRGDDDGAQPDGFLDQILWICKKTDADAPPALERSGRGSFADDVDARACARAYGALEAAEDEAPRRLRFKNRALRAYVVSIMSSSKRGALGEALDAWRDAEDVGKTVARQVRSARSTLARTFKGAFARASRSGGAKRRGSVPSVKPVSFSDRPFISRSSNIDVGRDQATAHLPKAFH